MICGHRLRRRARLGRPRRRRHGSPIAERPACCSPIGGSYGGGYQFVAAFTELARPGYTRLNALAPEITWFNLSEALAPNGVSRTAWVTLLYAAGAPMVPDYIHPSFAYGARPASGPTARSPAFRTSTPSSSSTAPRATSRQGRSSTSRCCIGQGLTDNLFNLNQGVENFEQALTPRARARSTVRRLQRRPRAAQRAPLGTTGGADACCGEGGFAALSREFFRRVFAGEETRVLPAAYNYSTVGDRCVQRDSAAPTQAVALTAAPGLAATSTAAGAPQHVLVAAGPLTLAGVPRLDATLTSVGVDARAFVGLSVGASPASAQVIQNNVMPIRSLLPSVRQALAIELPGVAFDVPAGQNLYLTVSPVSDMFFGHGSRAPGAVALEGLTVHLPVVGCHRLRWRRRQARGANCYRRRRRARAP